MKIKYNQIRDLEIIENELRKNLSGVLAYNDELDNIQQIVVPFVYLDKNIFAFFSSDDENFNKIVFDNLVRFAVYNEKSREEKKYSSISIKCCGNIKKVEDSKLYDEVLKLYSDKYGEIETEYHVEEFEEFEEVTDEITENESEIKLIIIDTEEIQAAEMIGE